MKSIIWYLVALLLPAISYAQPGQGSPVQLPNPLANNITSIEQLVLIIINNIVIPIGSVVVVFFIIYSGFLFVTAQGNESKLERAKHSFLWALVGAAVLLGAWAIAVAIRGTLCQIAPTLC